MAAAVVATCALAAACSTNAPDAAKADTGGSTTSKTIVLVPKQTSDPFFTAAESGAKEAAGQLGYSINYVGPTTADAAGQVTTLESALQSHPAAITIAPNDPDAVAPVLKKAMEQGVVVSAFNADAAPDARQFFVSQASDEGIAEAIVDTMAEQTNGQGTFLLVTSTATAANQKTWLNLMKPYIAKKYPNMKIAQIIPGNDDPATVLQVTSSYLSAHKSDTTGVWVIGGGMSGAVRAMQQLGIDPKQMPVAGLCIPSDVREDMHAGLIKNCVLWSPADTAYADVYAIDAMIKGTYPESGNGTLDAGRLGTLQIKDNVVEVGDPITFTADNIDQYKF
ncbi:MAG: substrate-binding domain-containing protein [Nocardioides sp.]|uniref:substrate-binding domain-containing protein n=1 Tax=Nocardioides sp. TaxID=35761 RepID=UPI0039E2BFBD